MALATTASGTYRRREPEHTILHRVVREHLERFLEEARSDGDGGYPPFVEREFRRYLDCGLLCHGFARVRCTACGDETLVAFSCKGRVCPSCQARRMADTAAYLVDQRLPAVPYRHWVLTVPWALRYRLSVDRGLLSRVLGTFLRTVFTWQRRRGRARGISDGQTGSVTFIQRFGGAMNLHPHVHCLIPDGLFVRGDTGGTGSRASAPASAPEGDGAPLPFAELPVPTAEEIEALTVRIAWRITAQVHRLAETEAEIGGRLEETAAAMQHALRRSMDVPLSPDPLPGLDPERDHASTSRGLCAKVAGFSLHAAQAIAEQDRQGLERLCRYGLRAPFSQQRLSLDDAGRVVYELPRPWPNPSGITQLVMEPTELLRRLAALCPSPRMHLVRYHGVFANRSALRARLPAPPPMETPHPGRLVPLRRRPTLPRPAGRAPRQRLAWAQLLARVFFVDVLWCPRCGGRRKILSFLSDPPVVRRILEHLGLPTEPPPLTPAPIVVDDIGGIDLPVDLPEDDSDVDEVPVRRLDDDRERGPP